MTLTWSCVRRSFTQTDSDRGDVLCISKQHAQRYITKLPFPEVKLRSGQTSSNIYIKALLSWVYSSHFASGQAETLAKLQSANWKWASMQLAEVEEKCDVRYPTATLTVPFKYWLAIWNGMPLNQKTTWND